MFENGSVLEFESGHSNSHPSVGGGLIRPKVGRISPPKRGRRESNPQPPDRQAGSRRAGPLAGDLAGRPRHRVWSRSCPRCDPGGLFSGLYLRNGSHPSYSWPALLVRPRSGGRDRFVGHVVRSGPVAPGPGGWLRAYSPRPAGPRRFAGGRGSVGDGCRVLSTQYSVLSSVSAIADVHPVGHFPAGQQPMRSRLSHASCR